MEHRWMMIDKCGGNVAATYDRAIIWEAVQFNVAEVCSKCSGGVTAGVRYQVFHPCAHLTAAEIVKRAEPRRPGTSSIEEEIEKICADVPEDEWNKLPTGLSENLDHYIYGTEKGK